MQSRRTRRSSRVLPGLPATASGGLRPGMERRQGRPLTCHCAGSLYSGDHLAVCCTCACEQGCRAEEPTWRSRCAKNDWGGGFIVKNACWCLQIQALGHFDDPAEAARAYDMAVLEWRGDKAVTNFPSNKYFGAGARSVDGDESSVVSVPSAARGAAEPAAQIKRKAHQAQDGALTGQAANNASQESSATATAALDLEEAPHSEVDTAGLGHGSTAARDSSIAADMFRKAPREAAAPAEAGSPNEDPSAPQPDMSPLIAMEQSTADVSGADLLGTPAEPVLALEPSAGTPQQGLDLTKSMPAGAAPHQEAPKRASRSRRLRSSAESASAPPIVFDLPMTRDEAIEGAVEGVRRAWAAGGASSIACLCCLACV